MCGPTATKFPLRTVFMVSLTLVLGNSRPHWAWASHLGSRNAGHRCRIQKGRERGGFHAQIRASAAWTQLYHWQNEYRRFNTCWFELRGPFLLRRYPKPKAGFWRVTLRGISNDFLPNTSLSTRWLQMRVSISIQKVSNPQGRDYKANTSQLRILSVLTAFKITESLIPSLLGQFLLAWSPPPGWETSLGNVRLMAHSQPGAGLSQCGSQLRPSFTFFSGRWSHRTGVTKSS